MAEASAGYLTGTTVGRYRVGALLGRGGMGEVYRAEDTELGRPVALKVLPETLVEDRERLSRFIQEARTASALNHPHVVSIYDVGQGTVAGRPVHFMTMELVEGRTLRSALDRGDTDLRRLLDCMGQAADALAAAHAAGIVHRDLKPENMMIASGGYVKVLDFGLAKLKAEPSLVEAAAGEPTVTAGTAPGLVMGTVGYMSPEQAQGRLVDHRSDVFAFGCILYEAATGTRAFSGGSAVDTLHQIIHTDPPPASMRAPAVPVELQRIVQKCLQKDPEERYQSMKEVAVDLRGLRRQLDSGSAALAVPPPRQKRSRTIAVLVAAAAVAVVAIAGALVARRWGSATSAGTPPISIQRVTDTGTITDAAISPDGKYLAYVDSNAGRQGLYLRQLSGMRPVELVPPTVGGFWGFSFARDGQSIYYAFKTSSRPSGDLFQIPVLGGTPRLLLSDIDSAVTFSPDGSRIAFLRRDIASGESAIVIAGADGSNAHPLVTKHPPQFLAPGFFVAPSWSPDGTRIAACVRDSTTRDARLATFDAVTGAETSFPDRFMAATATAWAPDGSGIYFVVVERGAMTTGNGGQIYFQPYPSGAVRHVTNDVLEYRNVSVTSDGRTLLAVGFEVDGHLSNASLTGGDERRLSGTRYDGVTGVAWVPDGTRIVFGRIIQARRTIWSAAAADGTDTHQLTPDDLVAGWPAVSPDGRTIVYFGVRGTRSGIWRAAIDGSNPSLIATLSDASSIVFAPDGRSLYFTSTMRGTPATYRVAVDGGEPALVTPLLERAGSSHDGRLLAGLYRAAARAPLMLGIVDTQTGRPVTTFQNFNPATGSGSIAWTADDKAILYTSVERANIWRQDLAGGDPRRVTSFADKAIIRFAVSPDGRSVLVCRSNSSRDAFLVTNVR